MNDHTKGAAVLDRCDVETALARVAVAAFTYYPEKPMEEPGYDVGEDVDWAMETLRALDADEIEDWRDRIATVISDAAADRRAFLADLVALADA